MPHYLTLFCSEKYAWHQRLFLKGGGGVLPPVFSVSKRARCGRRTHLWVDEMTVKGTHNFARVEKWGCCFQWDFWQIVVCWLTSKDLPHVYLCPGTGKRCLVFLGAAGLTPRPFELGDPVLLTVAWCIQSA